MKTYPHAFNEEFRVKATREVPGLTRENEEIFATICNAAKIFLECPIAHISVVDEHTQWYKSVVGVDLQEMSKDNSFCTHTIMSGEPMIIPDLSVDPKFAEHPMVADGGPKVRFYAGVPLILASGFKFGSLCVLDFKPHERPSDKEIATLTELGRAVVAALEKAPAKDAVEPSVSCQETFLTLVGHELRTPMTVIHGSLRMLEARMKDAIDQKLSKSASQSSDHLSKLISTILDFSDVRTGDLRLNEEPLDLQTLFREIYDTHSVTATEAGKTFAQPTCQIATPVLLDKAHIRICLISLLMNAALHGGDKVDLSVHPDAKGDIVIDVFDNGQIDDSVALTELYKPFTVGGDIMNRTTRGGLGLGLPLTRRLVELHGGFFEVKSDAAGTTARIHLPKWRLVT